MQVTIAAIGRLKDGGESELVARYVKRLTGGKSGALGPVAIKQMVESRHASETERRNDEANRLLKTAAGADLMVALDEGGRQFSSTDLATWLASRREQGSRHICFLLGGPDGHGRSVLEAAQLRLSLSPMTLPHGLARAVLVEQLYRANTIIAGHPYHRSG